MKKDHKWIRRGAAVVIAVILLASGILMLNANVRAAVLGAFAGQGHENAPTLYDVTIGYVPDGYVAEPENDRVAFLKYGDPTIRTIKFRPAEAAGYWDEPWGLEVAGSSFHYVPQIWIEIDRRGPGMMNPDPSRLVGVLEEITVNGRQAYRSFSDQWAAFDAYGSLNNNVIVLFDNEIVIRIQALGFDGNEAMKIAEGITW